jgi:hypothetical protein
MLREESQFLGAVVSCEAEAKGILVWIRDGSVLDFIQCKSFARICEERIPQLQKIISKVSPEMLAEMIGTTRSRVNFSMNKFRKLGFIHYNGSPHVDNSLLNVALHE